MGAAVFSTRWVCQLSTCNAFPPHPWHLAERELRVGWLCCSLQLPWGPPRCWENPKQGSQYHGALPPLDACLSRTRSTDNRKAKTTRATFLEFFFKRECKDPRKSLSTWESWHTGPCQTWETGLGLQTGQQLPEGNGRRTSGRKRGSAGRRRASLVCSISLAWSHGVADVDLELVSPGRHILHPSVIHRPSEDVLSMAHTLRLPMRFGAHHCSAKA